MNLTVSFLSALLSSSLDHLKGLADAVSFSNFTDGVYYFTTNKTAQTVYILNFINQTVTTIEFPTKLGPQGTHPEWIGGDEMIKHWFKSIDWVWLVGLCLPVFIALFFLCVVKLAKCTKIIKRRYEPMYYVEQSSRGWLALGSGFLWFVLKLSVALDWSDQNIFVDIVLGFYTFCIGAYIIHAELDDYYGAELEDLFDKLADEEITRNVVSQAAHVLGPAPQSGGMQQL